MRRLAWIIGLLALPLAACVESDAINNARAVSVLIDSRDQLPIARRQAEDECAQYNKRVPRLSNVTQFQHVLVVFNCRPADALGPEIAVPGAPAS